MERVSVYGGVTFSDPFGLAPCPPNCDAWDAADLGVGFVPVASTVADVTTALTGRNQITGDDVGLFGRGVAIAGALTPLSGGQLRGIGKIVSGLTERFGQPVTRVLAEGRNQLEFTDPKSGIKFIVRGPETHPITRGGPPVTHYNVEVHKPLGSGRFRKIGNAHLDEEGRVIR